MYLANIIIFGIVFPVIISLFATAGKPNGQDIADFEKSILGNEMTIHEYIHDVDKGLVNSIANYYVAKTKSLCYEKYYFQKANDSTHEIEKTAFQQKYELLMKINTSISQRNKEFLVMGELDQEEYDTWKELIEDPVAVTQTQILYLFSQTMKRKPKDILSVYKETTFLKSNIDVMKKSMPEELHIFMDEYAAKIKCADQAYESIGGQKIANEKGHRKQGNISLESWCLLVCGFFVILFVIIIPIIAITS